MKSIATGWGRCLGGVTLGMCLATVFPALTARAVGLPDMSAALGGGIEQGGNIEVNADKLEYDRKADRIDARGHVVIKKGSDELRADFVRVDNAKQEAEAYGDVVLTRPAGTWRGSRLHYNFLTRTGDCDDFTLNLNPFQIKAEKSKKAGSNQFAATGVLLTTCTNTLPGGCHYYVSARDLEAVPGQYFECHGAVMHLFRVPIFYLPYWYRNLRDEFGFRFLPGYDSDMGAFLLTETRYRFTPSLNGVTHLDYRTRRGPGIGEDINWYDPSAGLWNGTVSGYYVNDKNPLDDDNTIDDEIEESRYRIFLRHQASFTDADYMLMQGTFLSDKDMLEDFFEELFRESRQPENYVSYTHRADSYTLSALVRARINDFYSEVDRLPEVSLDFMRQQILDTPLYYEGKTAAAFLQRNYDKWDTRDAYSTFRFDTAHTVFYPGKYFGFLSIIPRAGYRGTYYSISKDNEVSTVMTTTSTTNAVPGPGGSSVPVVSTMTFPETVTNIVDGAAQFRSLVELGVEASYKAFGTWDANGTPMRHVFEPYANYTFVPEPNVLPEQLYQFDDVDSLTKAHYVQFGARNKIQEKRGDSPFDLIDLDTYTRFYIDREEGEDAIGTIFTRGHLRMIEVLPIDFDFQLSPKDGMTAFNTQVGLNVSDLWMSTFEYRFRKDESSLYATDVTLFPNRNWTWNAYGRYEAEKSRVEEVGGFLQRNLDCLSFRGGMGYLPSYVDSRGRDVQEEWRFILGIWVRAFPGGGMVGRYNR